MLSDILTGDDSGVSQRVMRAVLQMKKLDIAELERAGEGRGR